MASTKVDRSSSGSSTGMKDDLANQESGPISPDTASDCTFPLEVMSDEDDDDENDVEFFKVLVVGMAKSGKTSLIRRMVHNTFSETYKTTVGADYFEKTVPVKDQTNACVQIWDIAGQDRYAKLTRRYFSNADGAIVVCDVTSEYTIHAVMDWKRELDAWCGFGNNDQPLLPVILVANKCDLIVDISTAMEVGITMQKMVTETGIDEWFRASAKSGEKVNEAINKIVSIMMRRRALQERESPDGHYGAAHHGSDVGIIRLDESVLTKSLDTSSNTACNCN